MELLSSASFDQDTISFASGRHAFFPDPPRQPDVGGVPPYSHLSVANPALLILQAVERHYIPAADYRTYRLATRSTRYDDTVWCYITEIVKNVKSQTEAHLFSPSNPIANISFKATLKLACNTNYIHESAAIWVFLLVKNALKSTLNIRLLAGTDTASAAALVRLTELLNEKTIPRSYPEAVNYFLKTLTNERAVAKLNSVILRFTQLASMTLMLYAGDLYPKSCEVADVYEESTLIDIFIQDVNTSSSNHLRK